MSARETSSERGRIGAAVLAAGALLCLLALLPSTAAAATGSISGTVTDASTHEPVEGVEVCAEQDVEEGFFGCGLTETDGTYFIGGLPPGLYDVLFYSGGRYTLQFYDGAATRSEADPVEVLSGAKTTGIDVELQPTATIEGTVLATADGLGVEEVEVCAYLIGPGEEGFGRCGETGSDGSYEIDGLQPGDYKVEFWPGWTGRNLAYQFFDHKARFADADLVALTAGELQAGIDADLPPGASITGTVLRAATGGALEEVRVCTIEAATGKLTTCTWTNEKGKYSLRLLPSGSYKVVFSPELWEFFPGEAFPGEEDDGFPTQFWNNQTSLAAAAVLPLGTGGSVSGIDARLGPPAPVVLPPATPPVVHHRKHVRCRRGFHRRKVRGKFRCVKARRHKHHRRHGAPRSSAPEARFFRPLAR